MNPIRLTIAPWTLLAIVLLAAADVRAAEVPVRDGGSAQITLSARELTRIGMADGGKLDKLLGVEGTMEVKPDAASGDVFVRPLDPQAGKAFSFFVRDTRGSTYILVASVSDVPSQTVLLRPFGSPLHPKAAGDEKADPYIRRVKALMRAMATEQRSDAFGVEPVQQVVPVWQQTETVLEQRWSDGDALHGEIWSLRNRSGAELQLDESQFQGLYPDVRAIAIERQQLPPSDATKVYLIPGNGAVKLPDLKSALTVKRRQTLVTLAALFGLVLAIVGGLYLSDPHRKLKPTAQQKAASDVVKDYRTPGKAVDPAEIWITQSEAKLKGLEQTNTDLQRQLGQLQDQVQRLQNPRHTSGVEPPPLPGEREPAIVPALPTSSPAFPKTSLPPPPEPGRFAAAVPAKPVAPTSGILDVSLVGDSGKPVAGAANADKAAKPITVQDTLPTGAFTGVVLLNGLDAPTGGLAKTNPIPVLMHLLDNGTLPNRFHSRVRDCFVTGAGYGDLSSERAYIRLEALSCVMRDGQIVDTPIDGFIAGEDGKNGLRGTVVSKQGQMIARALFAGIASGLGQSISQSYSTVSTSALGAVQTVNPDQVFQAGAANGVGKALEKIADFYIARANELYPVVEVDSGRRGDVILTKKVSLGPTFAEAWSDP